MRPLGCGRHDHPNHRPGGPQHARSSAHTGEDHTLGTGALPPDPGALPPARMCGNLSVSATVSGKQVPLLAVNLSKMARTTSGSEIVATGITSTINTSAAVLLDAKLVVTVFTKGLPIGALTVYVTGKPAS